MPEKNSSQMAAEDIQRAMGLRAPEVDSTEIVLLLWTLLRWGFIGGVLVYRFGLLNGLAMGFALQLLASKKT